MQWILHRILAISGAADAPDDFDYENDDDAGAGDLEETEDESVTE